MPEKHDRPAESHTVEFFFFFCIRRMGGEKIFYFSHTVVFRQKKKGWVRVRSRVGAKGLVSEVG